MTQSFFSAKDNLLGVRQASNPALPASGWRSTVCLKHILRQFVKKRARYQGCEGRANTEVCIQLFPSSFASDFVLMSKPAPIRLFRIFKHDL